MEQVIHYIDIWGYTAIVVGMALESACIPIPSELIFGFAGYLVYLGRLDFNLAIIAGVVGGLIGSIAAYWVGYVGGRPLVTKYGKYIWLPEKRVDMAQKWFDRYGIITVFFSRLLPVIRTFISLPAGFARVNFAKFVIYTVAGSLPWTTGLIYAGLLLGENWKTLNAIGHQASIIFVIAILIVVVFYFWKMTRQHRQH